MLISICSVMVYGCGCKHDWQSATCIEPKICKSCGLTEGEALGHMWENSTCTEPKTCSICKKVEGEAKGHSWELIDAEMICTVCNLVDENAVIEYAPLQKIQFEEEQEKVKKYINIYDQNNVQNSANFLESNGWIYGQAWDDNGQSQFIKVRTDGSDFTVLDSGFAYNIYSVDNYIYYMLDNGEASGIYKIKTSGEDKQKIAEANGSMQVVDRQIYYMDEDYEYETDSNGNIKVLPQYCHLYRCELDGTNVTEIIAKPTFHFYVFADGIIYQDDNDNSSLHVCNVDGTGDVKLNDEFSYWPLYDGEYVYYVKESGVSDNSTRNIWRIKPDGTEDQIVADYEVSNGLIMTYNNLYFVYGDDSDRLYRIDKDGSNLTLVTQDINVTYPQLVGDFIKYTKRTDDYEYIEANYFCDYDGSGKWDFLDMAD